MYTKFRKRILIVMAVIALSYLILSIIVGCSDPTLTFDHEKWIKASENGKWEVRQKMAQYLIDEQTLTGKTKNEIVQLIGNPEEYSDVSKNELYYTINLNYGHDIDPLKIEYLIISLDSNDKVTKIIRRIALDKTRKL